MSDYEPDFSIIRMKCSPALSESLRYSQGSIVKSDWYARRTLPVIGRSPDHLYFSSSLGGGIINITEQPFFNDGIVGKIAVSTQNAFSGSRKNSLIANYSDDSGRIETRFAYDYMGQTFGLTDLDPYSDHPFHDKDKFNAVEYLTNSSSMTDYVVNDDPAALDVLDYNGIIEPFTIRTVVGMSSTFVGDEFDPEPHSIKAGLGGRYVLEPYHRFNPITEFYTVDSSNRNYPFLYCVDWRIYEGFSQYVPDFTYTNDDNDRIKPFVEKTVSEIAFKDVSDDALRNYFIYNVHSASIDNRPEPESKTMARGFVYDNCVFGSDSLAFGGLLK